MIGVAPDVAVASEAASKSDHANTMKINPRPDATTTKVLPPLARLMPIATKKKNMAASKRSLRETVAIEVLRPCSS
ncbi:MAG: hypothetical protein GWP25_02410 [Euryarchaeota archaeon]|nr:hypothetical protein [Euryarchaeota archaeon]